ncbi:hypothetical protein [Bradyrhizobium septentrionale]|uniref:Uncharacterized protein n=1 Tax=Bradyrhizobium septentrionale TaxID=1404411 RepID=A0A973WAQ6_9BRAD|nr:hypothetical protein [Bradyrhizobium septentrionale]UGY18829.1 hypothetical protein HAP48_0016050 [Bradyrhizobium septentrionale]UGY27559.1 hypothetical protein HU675_0012795 [Bradyrhizobium septentrionale]
MKNFGVLAVFAVLTIGNAVAALPGAAPAGHVASARAVQPLLTMAEQELPFDRYWSKN